MIEPVMDVAPDGAGNHLYCLPNKENEHDQKKRNL